MLWSHNKSSLSTKHTTFLFILISSRSCTCTLDVETFFEVETQGKESSSNDQQYKWWETDVDGLWKEVTQEEDGDPGKHGC